MSRATIIQRISAFALSAIVLFTVSVRDVHYLVVEHHGPNDQCQNHLHSADKAAHCVICKFDAAFFTDSISHPEFAVQQFNKTVFAYTYQSIVLYKQLSSSPLRGPPFIA